MKPISTKVKKIISASLDSEVEFSYNASNILMLKVSSKNLLKTVEILKEQGFNQLVDLFAVDYPELDARFEVVYSFLNIKLNQRIIIKTSVNEKQALETIEHIHPSAIWFQREVFDMYGVEFSGASDLRRILTDYGFEGHPLRKDFPVFGYKEVRYDENKQEVIYEPVNLAQAFREFDFLSSWEGTQYKLPGDEKADK